MAFVSRSHVYLLFIFVLIQSTISLLSSPLYVLPLTKDPNTHQHLTHIYSTNLVLDLNSPFLWVANGVNISPYGNSPVPRRSIQCSATGLDHSGLADHLCSFSLRNPFTGESALAVLVMSDSSAGKAVNFVTWEHADRPADKVMSGGNHDLSLSLSSNPVSIKMTHVSAPSILLSGLAKSAKGVLGLGKNRVGVVEQVSHTLGLSKKFSICLSNLNGMGMVLFGENHEIEVFKSMVYTPILIGNGDTYHIKLKSLKVQNKKLPLVDKLTTFQMSTISPYTLMESRVYKEVIKAFATEAEAMSMIRASSIGQFELCYEMNEMKKVPIIDLVLQSEMVRWRIYEHNSMVKVNDEVMCLGVLDGGEELGASIVLGSHQLEDNLVEFDLGNLMMGFSSLVMKQASCSQLSSSMHKDVQSL